MPEVVADPHKKSRCDALSQARELLWDNIEKSIWWNRFQKLSEDETPFEKIRSQHSHFHPAMVSFVTAFTASILEIEDGSARLVLQYGASRRLQSIYRAAKVVAKIAYPDRVKVCSKSEHERLGDALMIVYICIPAFFDALAMASHRIFKPKKVSEKDSNLFSRKYWHAIGLEEGYTKVSPFIKWHKRITNDMRHHYAHRIPPYVPPAEHSPLDADESQKLMHEYSKAVSRLDFEAASRFMEQEQNLGSFSPKIYFFELDAWTPLNPTFFNDIFTFQVIALELLEVLLSHEDFRTRSQK